MVKIVACFMVFALAFNSAFATLGYGVYGGFPGALNCGTGLASFSRCSLGVPALGGLGCGGLGCGGLGLSGLGCGGLGCGGLGLGLGLNTCCGGLSPCLLRGLKPCLTKSCLLNKLILNKKILAAKLACL